MHPVQQDALPSWYNSSLQISDIWVQFNVPQDICFVLQDPPQYMHPVQQDALLDLHQHMCSVQQGTLLDVHHSMDFPLQDAFHDSAVILPQNPYRMLLQLAQILYGLEMTTSTKCKRLQLLLRRNTFRKHDFVAYLQRMSVPTQLGIYPVANLVLVICSRHWLIKTTTVQAFGNMFTSPSEQPSYIYIGGGSSFSLEELQPYLPPESGVPTSGISFRFEDYVLQSELGDLEGSIACDIPIHLLSPKLTIKELQTIASCHGIPTHSKSKRAAIQNAICNHMCEDCQTYAAVFEIVDENQIIQKRRAANLKAVRKYQEKKGDAFKAENLESVKKRQEKMGNAYRAENLESVKKHQEKMGDAFKAEHLESAKKHQAKRGDTFKKANLKSAQKYQDKNREQYRVAHREAVSKHTRSRRAKFPPSAPTLGLQHSIISEACNDMSPDVFEESGCGVCGRLTLFSNLLDLSKVQVDLSLLINPNVTQMECSYADEPTRNWEHPILEEGLDNICKSCYSSLNKGKMPLHALANGKWIGAVPKELSDLSFAEQLLVSRVRHNRCIVRVSSGMHKMRANAITFENPTPKVYDMLPPPIEDLDEVLAFIYTGPCKPTKADFERTPLLVRKNKVRDALEWLKLNHSDYYDLEISYRNLDEYPEDGPPVSIIYSDPFTSNI